MTETALDLGSAVCFHHLGWGNSIRVEKEGGYAIICSHKYIKLAAYQLISLHDPSKIFSVHGHCLRWCLISLQAQ